MHPSESAPIRIPDICLQRIDTLLSRGGRRILGIAAPPGAGKSTLAEALARYFDARVQIVPMDGFHLANSELQRLGRHTRKGAADTFDGDGFVDLMRRIKSQPATEQIYAPEFRRELEEAIAGAIAVDAATPLVITEGNYLLLDEMPWRSLRAVLDEVWYLDVDERLRHQRLLMRHMRFGRSQQEALDWIAQTDEPNALRIAAQRHRADLCLRWD